LKVEIRPLKIDDAKVSWKWRNDPVVWKYTGSKPKDTITYDVELKWIKEVIGRKDERRFAICVGEVYVGNIQLTNITDTRAEYHIFIGDTNYWGKGTGYNASKQIIKFARDVLNLSLIYLFVKSENERAVSLYEHLGFASAHPDGKMELFL